MNFVGHDNLSPLPSLSFTRPQRKDAFIQIDLLDPKAEKFAFAETDS
jgi:hypothetical protein